MGASRGCLPNLGESLEPVLDAVWHEAVRSLPSGARVLDLATGDGVVLTRILRRRRDLKLIGVDSAPTLPKPSKGVTLREAVAMEKLPFPDRHFHLVTSQFGFEYGDTRKIAWEAARILVPGGAYRFVVHHAGGPIVAHNRRRLSGLAWVSDRGLFAKAKALAAARVKVALPTPDSFKSAPSAARAAFGRGSVAEEISMAVLETLEGRSGPPALAKDVLEILEVKARHEASRIEALLKAAAHEEGVAEMARHMLAAGLLPAEPATVAAPRTGEPIAWLLRGAKA